MNQQEGIDVNSEIVMARFLRLGWFVLSVFFAGLLTSVSHADDSDAQILDLWMNSAPVDLLVGEIAEITGREIDLEGDLDTVVSGRYTGSVYSILDAVAREHPVLFDIDDSTISAVSEAKRTVSSIVADEEPLDDTVRESITTRLLNGNSVEFSDKEIVVTGHPRFVNRTARQLSSALADQGRRYNGAGKPAEQQAPELPTQASLETMTAIDEAEPVTDAAAAVVLSDITQAADAVSVDQQATASVSDISGNDANPVLEDAPGDGTQATLVMQKNADEQAQIDQVEEDPVVRSAASESATSVPADDETFDTEIVLDEPSSATPEVSPTPREYRWVTDIPGFDTF